MEEYASEMQPQLRRYLWSFLKLSYYIKVILPFTRFSKDRDKKYAHGKGIPSESGIYRQLFVEGCAKSISVTQMQQMF